MTPKLTVAPFLFILICWFRSTHVSGGDQANSKTVAVQEALAKVPGFSGTILVRDSAGVFEKACGHADRAGNVPATLDTIYGVASISKQFTALAILQLQDAGRLSVDDPIAKFFSDVPEDKKSITLIQLLTHTSGLGQNYSADGIVQRDEAVKATLASLLEKKPGEGFSYSNDGYTLLAAIVEIVSGVEFDRYIQEHIFKPAGMNRSNSWSQMSAQKAPDAAEYLRDVPAKNAVPNWGFRGSTGIHTTVRDVDHYWNALTNDTLVSSRGRKQMFTPRTQTKLGPYGFGWFVGNAPNGEHRYMTRGNEDFGPNGMIIVYPDRPLLIVVLSHSFVTGTNDPSRDDVPMSRRLGEEIEHALVVRP